MPKTSSCAWDIITVKEDWKMVNPEWILPFFVIFLFSLDSGLLQNCQKSSMGIFPLMRAIVCNSWVGHTQLSQMCISTCQEDSANHGIPVLIHLIYFPLNCAAFTLTVCLFAMHKSFSGRNFVIIELPVTLFKVEKCSYICV